MQILYDKNTIYYSAKATDSIDMRLRGFNVIVMRLGASDKIGDFYPPICDCFFS